jgi:hypothetical protein
MHRGEEAYWGKHGEGGRAQRRIFFCVRMKVNPIKHCVNAVVGVHIKDYRNGWKNNLGTFPTRKDSMMNYFQFVSKEIHLEIN